MTILDAGDPRVATTWQALEAAARPTYFLTWAWMERWIAALPASTRPQLVVIYEAGAPVAAAFLCRRRTLRHGVLPLRIAALNTTGILQLDELCLEHNGLLSLPGRTWSLAELTALLPAAWDELSLPAVDAGTFAAPPGPEYQLLVDREVASPYVDLERVRGARDYLSLLSSNTRSQIRRSLRALGPSELEVASSRSQAFEFYDELVRLHTASWRLRGQPGAFADPWFDRFHRDLITARFAHGDIELLRLRAGGQTIGCLYNLVAHGRVAFYQSGLAPATDPHVKPGYVCQAAAIERAAKAGHAIYDFLGGDARYKASLATDSTRMQWLRVQRRLTRFALEDRVIRWKRAVQRAYATTVSR